MRIFQSYFLIKIVFRCTCIIYEKSSIEKSSTIHTNPEFVKISLIRPKYNTWGQRRYQSRFSYNTLLHFSDSVKKISLWAKNTVSINLVGKCHSGKMLPGQLFCEQLASEWLKFCSGCRLSLTNELGPNLGSVGK